MGRCEESFKVGYGSQMSRDDGQGKSSHVEMILEIEGSRRSHNVRGLHKLGKSAK